MTKDLIKTDCLVVDRWYPELGTGRITKVLKTRFTVLFGDKEIKYDFPHAKFLDKVESV